MSVGVAVVRAGRWHIAAPLAVLLLATRLLQQSTLVALPVVDWLVPVPVLVALVASSAGLLPLYATFDLIEPTLVRTPTVRLAQLVGSWVLVLLACWPATRFEAAAPLVCLLLATGTVAVVLIGEFAWLVALTLGFASVVMDGSPTRPVTTALAWVPLPIWLATVAAAGVVYWLAGPKGTRV